MDYTIESEVGTGSGSEDCIMGRGGQGGGGDSGHATRMGATLAVT